MFGSNKNKITKDKNGENVPHLEIIKVVLVYCNMVNKTGLRLKTAFSKDRRFFN